ncbi:unnamed protein product (macronuclear) [Paramecium tetraurelia]|uniref:Uncharacterized protein n=1 Tax=Paramecium tetraurelia TaxID=5888 RepID=A0D7S1_PARTE|nr:uncharacterized protein GSPATT00014055001 [Paramecium tetraurelia]CAK79088.1 unnamed protein product [Paramecium tetraurelia]|eukprot:XP_001446485.1 hypothetical protein (macronuclear) [Paramecium tetraurelia strain d4-2]
MQISPFSSFYYTSLTPRSFQIYPLKFIQLQLNVPKLGNLLNCSYLSFDLRMRKQCFQKDRVKQQRNKTNYYYF